MLGTRCWEKGVRDLNAPSAYCSIITSRNVLLCWRSSPVTGRLVWDCFEGWWWIWMSYNVMKNWIFFLVKYFIGGYLNFISLKVFLYGFKKGRVNSMWLFTYSLTISQEWLFFDKNGSRQIIKTWLCTLTISHTSHWTLIYNTGNMDSH